MLPRTGFLWNHSARPPTTLPFWRVGSGCPQRASAEAASSNSLARMRLHRRTRCAHLTAAIVVGAAPR
eukprot:14744154-Alexandrium_andersonii.AAC.1